MRVEQLVVPGVECVKVVCGGEVAVELVEGAVDAGCYLGQVKYIQSALIIIRLSVSFAKVHR